MNCCTGSKNFSLGLTEWKQTRWLKSTNSKQLHEEKPYYIVSLWFKFGVSVLQPQNFSRCNSYLLTSVGAPSGTALLQHGIQFLLPLKLFLPIQFQVPPQVSPHSPASSLTINILPVPPIHANQCLTMCAL